METSIQSASNTLLSHETAQRANERVGENETNVRLRAERSDKLVCLTDQNGYYLCVSEALADLLGYSVSEMIGRSNLEFIHPDDRMFVASQIGTLVGSRSSGYAEVRTLSKSGAIFWLAWSGKVDKETKHILGTAIDVTERKLQQEIHSRIVRSVSHLSGDTYFRAITRKLIEEFGLDRVAVSKVEPGGKYLSTVSYLSRDSGELPVMTYELERTACEGVIDARGIRIYREPADFFPRDPKFRGVSGETYIGCPVLSAELPSAPLGILWAVYSGHIQNTTALEWVLSTLAAKVASEFERESREAILSRRLEYSLAILRTSPDTLWVLDEELTFRDYFYHREKEMPLPASILIGRSLDEALPKDVADRLRSGINLTVKTGQVANVDFDLRRESGEVESYHARVLTTSDDNMLVYVRNVTAERGLRAEQQRHSSVLEASTDIVGVVTADRKIAYMNPAGCRFFGLDQAMSKNTLIDELQPPWAVQLRDNICIPLAIQNGTWSGETALLDKDGSEVPFSQLIVAHRSPETGQVESMSTVLRNISERKEFEEKIAQQQTQILASAKMAALGEMAAGIAHEINNPLAVIQGSAERLAEVSAMNDLASLPVKAFEAASRVERMAERIARIVKSLRFFARDGETDPMVVRSIQGIIDETLELCRTRFNNHRVMLKLEVPEKDVWVRCRPVQISQVLVNLLSNSFDAIRDSDEKWICIEVLERKEAVEVSVTDSGHGVPMEIADKIMQPFFTTKELGSGTGLGLSISRGIVKAHGGSLELDYSSEQTRFVFGLERAEQEAL